MGHMIYLPPIIMNMLSNRKSPYFNPFDPLSDLSCISHNNLREKTSISNNKEKKYNMIDKEEGVIKFFNRSSMCILNHFGRMGKYVEYDDLERSSNQFKDSVPKISEYIGGTDPRPFFIDRGLEEQDDFSGIVGYIGLVGKFFSSYAKSNWTWDSNALKELIRLLDRIVRSNPDLLDKSVVCSPEQFKDIRKEYLERGKVDIKEILKKDYSIKPKVDSVWT